MGFYSTAVNCSEVEGTRTESFESGTSGSASVTLKCAWADRLLLIDDIVGLRRAHPDYIGLRAMKATPRPFGSYVSSDQVCVYSHALITVEYRTITEEEEAGGEEVLSERLEPNAEFMLTDHSMFQWGTTPNDLPLQPEEAPGLLVRSATLIRNWRNVPGPLSPAIVDKIGCCNNQPYYSIALNQTFPTETLLYVPPSLPRTYTSDGVSAWDIDMRFMFRKETWNKYFHAGMGSWEYIRYSKNHPTLAEQIYKAYPPTDIGDLLII